MEKERAKFIDLAKGICILLVVLYHTLNHFEIQEYVGDNMLRVIRMPLYFFLSGLFFKPYENYIGFLKRKVNKLLIPFVTFYVLIVLTVTYFCHFTGIIVQENVWQPLYAFIWPEDWSHNAALWFLICLFMLNNIFYWLYIGARLISQQHWNIVLFVFTMTVGAVGYTLGRCHINLPCFIDSAMTAMPFFMFGYLIHRFTSFLSPNRVDKCNPLLVVVGLLYCYIYGKYENFRLQEYETNLFVLYSSGLLGTLSILLLSKMIGYIPFVSYCGRYSIMILVTHRPIVSMFVR